MTPTLSEAYRESLPPDCPPATAEKIVTVRYVFRLVRTTPPTELDFRSYRAEHPERVVHGVSECQTRGLSVYGERRDAERLLRSPRFRGRLICRVELCEGAGRIEHTGGKSHYTWWPLAEYNILGHCDSDPEP